MIQCACGCKTLIEARDNRNRPKFFVHGHAGRVQRVTRRCSCGCGSSFVTKKTSSQMYIRGHHNKMIGFSKGYTPWNKGKHFMPTNIEQLKEIGKKYQYKKGELSGEKHHNWRGGVTPVHIQIRNSEEGKQWRINVFKRDNYTCVLCGQRGGELIADHIKGFSKHPELRFELSNGRTLCKKCNYKSTYILKEWDK